MKLPQLTLQMPNPSSDQPPVTEVQHSGRIVIVGANGSGKSRLGAWFENPIALRQNRSRVIPREDRKCYRISAQRILALPDHANRVDSKVVSEQLIRGSSGPGGELSRVQGDPVVGQSNDYSLLVDTLFADRDKNDREYRERGTSTKGNPGLPPEDTLEKLRKHWETIFSERSLIIGDHVIEAKPLNTASTYSASSLSDGERVGFYLIGHALLAPLNNKIVIDEPELHLHESIQSILWDKIETLRSDCTFIYITHDLGFAASRRTATKIVLYDYEAPQSTDDVGQWKWSLVQSTDEFPEDVYLRILGSRRSVLFTEGKVGGLEHAIFEVLYPKLYVVPSNNCSNVDRSVRAFRSQTTIHHLKVFGVIDRDDRQQPEIDSLQTHKIHVLPVACIENLFALQECLEFYVDNNYSDPTERQQQIDDAKNRVIEALRKVKAETIDDRARYAIDRTLNLFLKTGFTKDALVSDFNLVIKKANPSDAYEQSKAEVDQVFSKPTPAEQYSAALFEFRNKSVLHEIAVAFKTSREKYISFIIESIKDEKNILRAKLLSRLPDFN